ncbi:MAG: hypothetical protein JNJ80_21385 [Gemmatimonadetes bacterium]|nr:hypothetical protein [Gemmatimonadota bacterium]
MQRDVVIRWIHQISALIARLLRRDPGVSIQFARDQLADAKRMLLGGLEPVLDRLEPGPAADFLVDPHRIYGFAQLVALESALERVHDRAESADRLGRRAVALAREAISRSEAVQTEWVAWTDAAERDLGGSAE